MTKHVWTVVCASSIIDTESNNISLLNVLEEVRVSRPPKVASTKSKKDYVMVPLGFEIVSLWVRENPEEKSMGSSRIMMYDSGGPVLKSKEADVDLREYQRMRLRRKFSSFPMRNEGQYWVVVEYKAAGSEEWCEVDRIPLLINVEKGERGQ